MRALLLVLLLFHAALHGLGFVEWSGLRRSRSFADPALFSHSALALRVFALLWLVASAGFVLAAWSQLRHDALWWKFALGAVALSEALILFAWSAAKYGSLPNACVLIAAVAGAAQQSFRAEGDARAQALITPRSAEPTASDSPDVRRLPDSVRAWLERSGALHRPQLRAVRLRQQGELRTGVSFPWMPARAEQYFSLLEPSFVWNVDATLLGLLPITGRDEYLHGKGRMLVKAASLVTLVDAGDEKLTLGAQQRFLAEIVWFPMAALASYVRWKPGPGPRQAQATLDDRGSSVSVSFGFDEQARVSELRAQRYLGGGVDAKLTPWLVTCTKFGRFEGIEIPVEGQVGWELASGTFYYYRWRIVDVDYDPPALYSSE